MVLQSLKSAKCLGNCMTGGFLSTFLVPPVKVAAGPCKSVSFAPFQLRWLPSQQELGSVRATWRCGGKAAWTFWPRENICFGLCSGVREVFRSLRLSRLDRQTLCWEKRCECQVWGNACSPEHGCSYTGQNPSTCSWIDDVSNDVTSKMIISVGKGGGEGREGGRVASEVQTFH